MTKTVLIMLAVFLLVLGACAKSTGSAPSNASLSVNPASQTAAKGNTVTFSATGLKSGQDVRIRITTSPELDVTTSVNPALTITPSGTFETKLVIESMPPGSYTVKLVGQGESVLASAPLEIKAPPPAKPK